MSSKFSMWRVEGDTMNIGHRIKYLRDICAYICIWREMGRREKEREKQRHEHEQARIFMHAMKTVSNLHS